MLKLCVGMLFLQALVGCAGVQHVRVLDLSGTSGAKEVSVRVVDPRSGMGYTGTVLHDGTQIAPLGGGAVPALVLPLDSRVTVDAVKAEKTS